MPVIDPDAELASLKFTIPSWSKTIIKDNGTYGFFFHIRFCPARSQDTDHKPYTKNKQTADAVGGGFK